MRNSELERQRETLTAVGPTGSLLRVEFVWRGDRFGHSISLVASDRQAIALLESVEGTSGNSWPASPPFQSLRIEELSDGRPAALLVGSAGSSHWSASIETVVDEAKLVFDLACRHAAHPEWLGSCYRLLSDAAKKLSINTQSGRITEDHSSDERILKIEPLQFASAPGTTRWKFTIQLQVA
jgi:hypothetical protein